MTGDLPIYESIKRTLRDQIRAGDLKEGDPVPSENELSAHYGASRHQTRQALRELELEGYLSRSQGKRSRVAPASRRTGSFQLQEGRRTVAIALQSQCTHFERGIYNGIQHVLSQGNFQSITYTLMFNDNSEREFLEHVQDIGVAGLILWMQHPQGAGRRLLRNFKKACFPVVLVDRDLPGLGLDSVTADNRAIGRELTERLIARGHREIGFLTDIHNADSARERFLGHQDALKQAGLPCRDIFFGALHTKLTESGSIIRQIMSHKIRPTAFTCIHELFMGGLVMGLRSLGFEVPRDIELAAVADEGVAKDLGVPIIGARQPAFEMGREAAETLLNRILEPGGETIQRRLPAEFFMDKGLLKAAANSA